METRNVEIIVPDENCKFLLQDRNHIEVQIRLYEEKLKQLNDKLEIDLRACKTRVIPFCALKGKDIVLGEVRNVANKFREWENERRILIIDKIGSKDYHFANLSKTLTGIVSRTKK